MKLSKAILVLELLCVGASGNAMQIHGISVILSALAPGQQMTKNPVAPGVVYQTNAFIDVRDYGVTGDGTTNDTAAMSALLTTVGSSPARLMFPPRCQPLLNAISFPANVTLDFSAGGALTPVRGQTITILGRIVGTTQQIFYNALPGQGTIDFTGGYALQAVYPEWWGASPGASAATNTPALQAAEYAAFGTNRTNGSGLAKYNRELQLCGMYATNDELRFYHVIGFRITGCGGKVSSGLRQTATNRRIIDGQNIAYGVFDQLKFETTTSQNVPLIDLDNDHTHGVDLSPQNITFRDVIFTGNGLGQIGVLIAKHGGDAQGDNIRCEFCYLSGFTQAGWQIGVPANRAQNAIREQFIGGDIQACPQYGIASYGGSIDVFGTTMENGFSTVVGSPVNQIGFDVYCQDVVAGDRCSMKNVRSESLRLMAGSALRIEDSYMVDQSFFPTPGETIPLNGIIQGSLYGGHGVYYRIMVSGVMGGSGTPTAVLSATGGSLDTLVSTGAGWTGNAFTGFEATIMVGSGNHQYCVITSNTSDTLTCTAGWLNDFVTSNVTPTVPDATSQFIIEPNWGTQFASGGATWASMGMNAIEGTGGGGADVSIDNVFVAGMPVRVSGTFKNFRVTALNWYPASGPFPVDGDQNQNNFDGVRVVSTNSPNAELRHWTFRRNSYPGGSQPYTDSIWHEMGGAFVWPVGQPGGGLAAYDTWIGGRHDPGSTTSLSRAILEYGGMLGRATPVGARDANGRPTQIEGGLPTGAGTPGAIEFWLGNTGLPGTSITDGTKRATIDTSGFTVTGGIGSQDGSVGSKQTNTSAACEASFGITTLRTVATTTETGLTCLPETAIIDAVVYRITTTITTAASFTIGDATTAARFCSMQSTMTAGATGVCFVQADQAGARGPRQTSAAKVRVTTNANPGAGAMRLIVYYHTWTPPAS